MACQKMEDVMERERLLKRLNDLPDGSVLFDELNRLLDVADVGGRFNVTFSERSEDPYANIVWHPGETHRWIDGTKVYRSYMDYAMD
jgi:hypothetical protein